MSRLNKVIKDGIEYKLQDLDIGNLENLPTEDKSSIVNALIELADKGNGIVELTKNTNLYEMPYGIYKVSDKVNLVNVRIGTSGSWKSNVAYPGELLFWTKLPYSIGTGSANVLMQFSAVDDKQDTLRLRFYKVINNKADLRSEFDFNGIVRKNSSDSISGLLTFTTLPKSSVVPTEDNHLVNKAYVDGITGSLDDLSTEDKSSIINAINEVFAAMANGGGGEGLIPLTENVSIDSLTPGIYINATTSSILISSMLSVSAGQLLICNSLIREGFSTNHIAFTMKMDNYVNGNLQINLLHGSGTTLKTKTYTLTENPLNVKDQQTITGKKTFSTLPESSAIPTTNNQFTNKAYVDNLLANMDTKTVIPLEEEVIKINDYESGIYQPTYNGGARVRLYNESGTKYTETTSMTGSMLIWNKEKRTFLAIFGNEMCVYSYYGTENEAYPLGKNVMYTFKEQEISGKKTFTTLPESSVVPTLANQLVNKGYVDGLLSSAGKGIQELKTNYSGQLPNGVYLITGSGGVTINGGIRTTITYGYGTMVFKDTYYFTTTGTTYHIYMALDMDTTTYKPRLKIDYNAAGSYGFTTKYLNFDDVASKDYVDTAIANAITTVLEGEY